jgi:GNAT superfamily N-acetyltransferase
VVSLFERPGPRGGTPISSGCWCQFWLLRGRQYEDGWGRSHKERLQAQVRGRRLEALLAYRDGEPVGWCRLGPRETFARLEASNALARIDDAEVWSVVCFVVHPTAKRQGVASVLLEAACARAAARGASILEGYAARANQTNIDAYTGYLPMFLAAGFEPVGDGGRRTIVRRRLSR